MAEEFSGDSHTSSLSLKPTITISNNNSNQQPSSVVDEIPEDQFLSCSPKKPNLEQEIPSETVTVTVTDELGTQLLGGNSEPLQVSDQLFTTHDTKTEFLATGSESNENPTSENPFFGFDSEKKIENFEYPSVDKGNDETPLKGLNLGGDHQFVGFDSEKKIGDFEYPSVVANDVNKGLNLGGNPQLVGSESNEQNENEKFGGFLGKLVKSDGITDSVNNGDALTTCSLKIEVIDGTAVVDVFNNNNGKKNKRRGKKGNPSTNGKASNGGKSKSVYLRKDLEALRYVNVKGQKKFWQKIYSGFEQTVKKEYDELGSFNKHQHKHGENRRQARHMRNNYHSQGILGESSSENVSCDAEISGSADFVSDGENSAKHGDDLVGELSEYEESDDEDENIQRPAFLVEGEPDFESGPPEDGLEYLRRVRWEARQIPKVKVAKIDNSKLNKEQSVYMPKIPDIEKCPPHLLPLKQWEDEFVADFKELRMALQSLDDTSDAEPEDSQTIIFNHSAARASRSSKNSLLLELPSGGPTLASVLEMDPVTRVTMLKKRVSLFDSASDFSKDDCAWLFALCAVIDIPLDADTSASLRCLLRKCAKLRAGKSEVDDEVVMLNILATISGKIFGQSEA